MTGVARFLILLFFIGVFSNFNCELTNNIDEDVLTTQVFMFWPNATVPFYIDRNHFDEEQVTALMSALSLFAFKTCVKFAPVLAPPQDNEHVLTFANPTGLRKCEPSVEPHNINEQQHVVLGYDCLRAPEIYMVIMRELGFPFEHNRAVRDLYIDVQTENVEPGYLDMFVKDLRLPVELRSVPYDRNSVMHFGEREYSKNGHKTIIFKDRNFRQERYGLSPIDLRKIEIVYGPECKKRDRQEKIELCQNYPGVARRKREASSAATIRSLRVNPDITPPPGIDEKKPEPSDRADDGQESKVRPDEVKLVQGYADKIVEAVGIVKQELKVNADNGQESKVAADDGQAPNLRADDRQGYTDKIVEELGIAKEVEDLISEIHKTAGIALARARERYCNGTKPILRGGSPEMEKPKDHNILTIIGEIASYSKSLVDKAVQNLTVFCEPSKSIDDYQRASCPFFNPEKCKPRFKSTKSGALMYSTQHRPILPFSTKHYGVEPKHNKESIYSFLHVRSGNETEPKENQNVSYVTKPNLRSNTLKIHFKRSKYEPNFRSGKNNTSKVKNERRKREVADMAAPAHDASSHGNKGLKRRFKGEKFRARALEGEEGVDVNWDESAISMDNDKSDATGTATTRGNRMSKATPKSDAFYHNHRSRSHERSGSSETSEAVVKRQTHPKHQQKPKETNHMPAFAISQEEVLKPPPLPKRHKEIPAPNKVQKKSRSKPKTSKVRVEKPSRHPVQPVQPVQVQPMQVQMQPKTKLRKPSPAPTAVTIRKEDKDKEAVEDVSIRVYKSASKVRKVKKAATEVRKKPPSIVSSGYSGSSGSSGSSVPSDSRPSSRGPNTVVLSPKNREFYNERKWPDNTVRYLIHDSGDFDLEDCRARLAEVADILRKETCVNIEEINEAQTDLYEDYLVLDNSPDFVTGRVGGRQTFGVVELLKGGQHRQHAAMMVMAMLGFYFEVSRHDRDTYIRVHVRHIRPDKLHHFEKVREDATFNLPYDYKSATHPAWQFWRHLGKSGISTVATYKERDPDGSVMKTLGQNEQLLSDLDIVKINSIYGIDCLKTKGVITDGGRDDQDLEMGESNEPPDEIPDPRAEGDDDEASGAGEGDVEAGNEDFMEEEEEEVE